MYKVNIDQLDAKLTRTASAFVGSNEYLIPNLLNDEFEVLFFDEWSDYPTMRELFEEKDTLSASEVLSTLKENYVDTI